MILDIPPTMIVTRVRAWCFVDDDGALETLVAAKAADVISAVARAMTPAHLSFFIPVLLLECDFVPPIGTPTDELVLEASDERLGDQRDRGEDEHRRVNPVRVERALGDRDHVAE